MKLFFRCFSLQIILYRTQHSTLEPIYSGLTQLCPEAPLTEHTCSDKLFPKEVLLIIGSSPDPEMQHLFPGLFQTQV